MVEYSKFDNAMEAGNHVCCLYCAKHTCTQCKQSEASSKPRMSRGNFFKYLGIISLAVVITVMVCSFGATSQSERWEYHSIDSRNYPSVMLNIMVNELTKKRI